MAGNNFLELVIATVNTLEDLLGGNESNTQIYTEQCKAMVNHFVQVRNCLPTSLGGAARVRCARIFKELYCLSSGALRILKLCCEKQTWLQAVIHIRSGPKWSTFETLRDELDWCFNILRSLDVLASNVVRLTYRDRERLVEPDEENLRKKLRDAARSGTSQEVSIATFLLARLDVNNGQPVDPNCIQQQNSSQPQYREPVPLIHLIEGQEVGSRVIINEQGDYSSVWRMTWFGINVAGKVFRNDDDIRIRQLRDEEAHIMAMLSHPNVVSFIGCLDGEEPTIIMEYEDQSLEGYIDGLQTAPEQPRRDLQTLSEKRRIAGPLLELVVAVDLLTQIASGMAYLHSQDIAHLDLKLANLLVTSHTECNFLHVKIADFGHSIRLKGVSGKIQNPFSEVHGTTIYRAVELFRKGERVCLKASDVCSFAFTAWAILHCHEPRLVIPHYDNEHEEPTVKEVKLTPPNYYNALNAGIRLGFDDEIPKKLQDFVERCWDNDPDVRPPASEIYMFLQSFKEELLGSNPVPPVPSRTSKPRSRIRLWPGLLCLGSRQGKLDDQHEESV